MLDDSRHTVVCERAAEHHTFDYVAFVEAVYLKVVPYHVRMHDDGITSVVVAQFVLWDAGWFTPWKMANACHLGDVVMDRAHLADSGVKFILGHGLPLSVGLVDNLHIVVAFQ